MSDDFTCCGGNDEHPPGHCADCPDCWPPPKPKWEIGVKVFFLDLGEQHVGVISGYSLHLNRSTWTTQYWCNNFDDAIDEDNINGQPPSRQRKSTDGTPT